MEELKTNVEMAKPEDAEELQLVFYKTWLETYPNEEYAITRHDVEQRFAERLTKGGVMNFADQIKNPKPNTLFLVAKKQGKVVGVCRIRKDREENELGAIYVLPEFQRQGVGDKLWQEAQKFFDKGRDIVVKVATYNDKAINFYKKLGFVDTGKRSSDESHRFSSGAIIPEMEMVQKVSE